MRTALKRLAKNKALGVDCLPDNTLHQIAKLSFEKDQFDGTEFLRSRVNAIFARVNWPSYLGTAKFVPLSKTDSEYPAPNDVRTIAVLPAISKLIEICILGRLEAVAYSDNRIIDDAQSGFRPGSGTEVHLVRVLRAIEMITGTLNLKETAEDKHEGYHLAFLDLKKAYDNVDRDLLLARMLALQIPTQITLLISKWLHINSAEMSTGRKKILKGVPQGGCLSPILFNIYINPLIIALK